ncbi:MAG: hypothetical protein JWP40_3580 [Blastococcus sp.]|nr:hypothetical protein [Blastococcus sp.]
MDTGSGPVAKLDNPAGRLHSLLTGYRETSNGDNRSVLAVWADVLGAKDDTETLLSIAETAGLIPQIEAAVIRSGDEDQEEVFASFAASWASAVLAPGVNLHGGNAFAVAASVEQLAVLGGLSSFLSATASEGRVPTDAEISDLRGQVQDLINSITEDAELPEEVKRLALDHAYRLAQALDHFRIGGPGAVKAATERLVGATVLAPDQVRKSSVWTRLMTVGGLIWTAFKFGPDARQALEGWTEIIKALPGGH